MKKILWTGLLAGVLMIIVSVLWNFIFSLAFPSFDSIYQNTTIFRSISDPLMSLFWIYPLVLGIGLSWIWSRTKGIFKKDTLFNAGLKFGWAYFVIAFIINVSSFNLPVMMILTWTLMNLFNGFIAGWVFAKWYR